MVLMDRPSPELIRRRPAPTHHRRHLRARLHATFREFLVVRRLGIAAQGGQPDGLNEKVLHSRRHALGAAGLLAQCPSQFHGHARAAQPAKRILREAGYTVLTAASPDDALMACKAHQGKIHLLLTDVVMPQMGGRVLAETLVVARPGIKVLYMSGYTDDAIVHHGTLDPGTHFIAKPFSAANLARKVREVLDSDIANPDA